MFIIIFVPINSCTAQHKNGHFNVSKETEILWRNKTLVKNYKCNSSFDGFAFFAIMTKPKTLQVYVIVITTLVFLNESFCAYFLEVYKGWFFWFPKKRYNKSYWYPNNIHLSKLFWYHLKWKITPNPYKSNKWTQNIFNRKNKTK